MDSSRLPVSPLLDFHRLLPYMGIKRETRSDWSCRQQTTSSPNTASNCTIWIKREKRWNLCWEDKDEKYQGDTGNDSTPLRGIYTVYLYIFVLVCYNYSVSRLTHYCRTLLVGEKNNHLYSFEIIWWQRIHMNYFSYLHITHYV